MPEMLVTHSCPANQHGCAPLPVKMHAVAVNDALFACWTNPPHGDDVAPMNTTGFASVPLMVIVPLLVMSTPALTITMLPAPTVSEDPPGIIVPPVIWIRELSGHAVGPASVPLIVVHTVPVSSSTLALVEIAPPKSSARFNGPGVPGVVRNPDPTPRFT